MENMAITYSTTAANANSTYQIRLYETSGVVEYVYGAMNCTVTTYNPVYAGFAVGATANSAASITYSSNTVSTGATFNSNTLVTGNITNLNSSADGSRRVYRFTPPTAVPSDPITLTYSAVAFTTTTVNWVDNSTNESFFTVTRATDSGFTANPVTTTVTSTTIAGTGTAYSSAQTGLSAGTLYYYKIQAGTEAGSPSTGLTGSQSTTALSPMSGVYSINNTLATSSPVVHDGTSNFASFTDAINYININGITGAVTFNVSAGQTFNENAPALTATGTITNTIIFQKSGSGANPVITPTGTSGTTDFGIAISGGDYITFDGIDINASAVSAVEYGYLIRNASATNGAQNNTIKNTVINMGTRAGSNSSYGILQTATSTGGGVSATNATGANSTNKYYNLTISNVRNIGVYLLGTSASFPDLACEIGTTTCSGRNSISNIGSTSTTFVGAQGIQASAQSGVKIFNNDISAVAGDQANAQGIYFTSCLGTTNELYANKIQNISVKGSTSTTSVAYGIQAEMGSNASSSVKIYNNFISNIFTSFTGSATATRYAVGLFTGISTNVATQTFEIDNNSISIGQGLTPTYGNTCYELQNSTPIYKVRGNIFANYSGAQGATAKHFGAIVTAAGIGAAGTVFDYNDYYIANDQGTSGHVARISSTNYNTITDWKAATTGTLDDTCLSANPAFTNPNSDLSSASIPLNAVSGFTPQSWVANDIFCVARSGKTPSDIGAFAFDPPLAPSVSSFTPSALCYQGGQTVTITGSNFVGVTAVTFNGVPAASFTTVSTTSITAVVPANVISEGVVTVTNGTGPGSSAAGYSVVVAPTIGVTSATTVCAGSSASLTATGGATYAWSPSTGLSATTGATVSATPTVTTTYTVTGTSAEGCTATNTVAVTVNPLASALTVSKNPTNVCYGGITTLTANGGTVSQNASGYSVAVSSGTFTPLSGGTTVAAVKADTAISGALPIGFTFNYAGGSYTNVYADSNGLLTFNSSATSTTTNTMAAAPSTIVPFIAPLWDDLDGTSAGTASYLTTGTAGNRVFTFEWLNWEWGYLANAATISFQVKLYEADGRIEFVYRPDATSTSSPSASAGLGGSTVGNYLSLSDLSSTATASSTTPSNSIALKPVSGQTYTFTKPVVPVLSWSSSSDIYTDAAATVPYTGGTNTVVYVKGLATGTFTATSTLGSCPTSGSATVTPNALPTISANSETICSGVASATLTAGGASTYSWSPSTGLSATTGSSVTANPSSTTTYTITGTDANGCVNTTTSVVTVNTPVAISAQPVNAVVLVGDTATFTINATATGITYQWQVNDNATGWSNISGANSATYTTAATDITQNNYQYRCIVSGTSPCAPVTSSAAILTVGNVSIATQPVSQTICSNSNATFSIVASGDVASYQWQYSTNGTTWTDLAVTGADTASITLSGLTATNSGTQYHCVLNAGAVTSNPATVTVRDAVVIGTQPSNQSVCDGVASVAFTTVATGTGLTYQWQVSTNGTIWNNVSGATNATYTINTPSASLNGNQYKVIVTGTSPCTAVTSDVATLTITNVTVAASSASICIGGSTTLNATFTGAPDYTTTSWTSTTGSGAETAVSGISATVTPTAAGTYVYTFASNGTCPFSKTVSVTVNALPIITSVTATPATVCSGATINLAAASVATASGNVTIGTGTDTTTLSTDGTPYRTGNTVGNQFKNQFLIKASELTAAGLAAGNITGLKLDVSGSGGGTLSNLTISVGHSSLSAMTTTYVTGLTQVYSVATWPATGALTTGLQTHTFNTPFNWDGTSNIVIQVCAQLATSGSAGTLRGVTTSFASHITNNPTTTACASGTTGSLASTVRPNIILVGQASTNLAPSYTWSWNTTPAVTAATGTTSVTNVSGSQVSQTFTATATSAAGCTNSLTTSAINVNSTISAPTANNSTQCGAGTPTCSVTGSGTPGATFKWYLVATNGTALAGQTGSTLSSYSISTLGDNLFYVSEVSADGLCESPRVTVTATVTAPYAFTLNGTTATNCSGSASLTPIGIATNGGYTSYSWSPATGVSGNETTGWTFSPTTTTTYTVTATGGGCSNTASVVVTPTALPVVNVAAVPSSICVGASSTLTALTETVASGTATIGAGATNTATYSNPFYSLWSNNHTQHLITAAELTAMGLKPGNITSVGLNVTSAGTLPMIDLSVKIGATSATSMTAFANNTGFQTVYTNASLLPTTGVNTLTFSTPFNWNGTSNIILEFCHGNSGSSATMSRTVLADNTSYVSTVKAHVSSATASATICADTATNLLSYSVRPLFIFNGQVASQGVGTLAYTWNDTASTTGNVLTVSPASTTSYTVYGYNGTTGCTGSATATVTVYTPPTAPSVTSAVQCGTRVPLVSVADTNGYTTPTFKWYADNTTTTALQTSTSTTYTTSVSATTTFYVSVVSPGGCESSRTAVTTTVVSPATLTVTPATTICTGGSATLTASGAVSYTWTPATGLNGTSGASVIATPSANTTYSVTGVDANGCTTAAATVAVTIAPYPSALTITQGAASVCTNGIMSLTATGGTVAGTTNILTENFNSGAANWTITNAGTSPTVSNWFYQSAPLTDASGSATFSNFTTLEGGSFAYANPDAGGSGSVTNTVLTSPSFSTVGFTSANLTFEQSFENWSSDTTVAVEISTNGGSTWSTLSSNLGSAKGTVTNNAQTTVNTSISLASYLNQSNLKIRYNYVSTWGYYWIVDNVIISGVGQVPTPVTWSSSTDLYSNSGATTAYAGQSTRVVYTKPSANITYTATATNGSCATTATTNVIPNPLPDFSVANATICEGTSTTLSATGTGYTYVWSPATGLNTTTGSSVIANPAATTTYTIVATDIATGCQKSMQSVVTVIKKELFYQRQQLKQLSLVKQQLSRLLQIIL